MMLPRTPAAVIFDMDGLFSDTETLYQEAILLAAAEAGQEVAPEFFGGTVGMPWAQSRALLLSHFGETFAADESQAAWVRHYCAGPRHRLVVERGRYSAHLSSARRRPLARRTPVYRKRRAVHLGYAARQVGVEVPHQPAEVVVLEPGPCRTLPAARRDRLGQSRGARPPPRRGGSDHWRMAGDVMVWGGVGRAPCPRTGDYNEH